MQVLVRDNNVDQALKALKKKMQREGIFREMKLRGHYEKPSEKRAREQAEAVRRARKLARKKMQNGGARDRKVRLALYLFGLWEFLIRPWRRIPACSRNLALLSMFSG